MANPLKGKKGLDLAQWKMLRTITVLIGLGVITSASAVGLERWLHYRAGTEELSWGWTTFLRVLDHLGLGFFSAAILGVVLEVRHMHEYFQHLIEQTIIKREFITTLGDKDKEAMQKQSLEAYFGSDLGKEGDFYDFFVKKIRTHIGGPYREGTRFKTVVEPTDANFFTVTETISYVCRKHSGEIQPEVCWTAEQDEIKDILDFDITATKPDHSVKTYPFDKVTKQYHPDLIPKTDGHGFTLLLKDYAACDGLAIKVEVKYLVSRERPFSWTMPYLSNGFSGEIYFPDNLEIFVDLFGMDKSSLPPDKSNLPKVGSFNFYEISHQGWLLPDDGFSFYFRAKPPAGKAALPVNQTSTSTAPASGAAGPAS